MNKGLITEKDLQNQALDKIVDINGTTIAAISEVVKMDAEIVEVIKLQSDDIHSIYDHVQSLYKAVTELYKAVIGLFILFIIFAYGKDIFHFFQFIWQHIGRDRQNLAIDGFILLVVTIFVAKYAYSLGKKNGN